jgi:hypothetical protein
MYMFSDVSDRVTASHFYSDDGGSMFLRNYGKIYRIKRPHIPENNDINIFLNIYTMNIVE